MADDIFADAEAFGFETRAIRAGQRHDPTSGAVVTPISLATTFVQEEPGVHRGYEYSRTNNPTRQALSAGPGTVRPRPPEPATAAAAPSRASGTR